MKDLNTSIATSVTTQLADALAAIASALQLPVMLLAVFILLAVTFETGRFLVELIRRKRIHTPLRQATAWAVNDPHAAGQAAQLAPTSFAAQAVLETASAVQRGDDNAIELALVDYELSAQQRLDRTRILVRTGPAVGLMGTLIPLAPGLTALGNGEITQLAADLRTAFAATVIGLLVGTIAFALTLTRTRMYSQDLASIEHATSQLVAKR